MLFIRLSFNCTIPVSVSPPSNHAVYSFGFFYFIFLLVCCFLIDSGMQGLFLSIKFIRE